LETLAFEKFEPIARQHETRAETIEEILHVFLFFGRGGVVAFVGGELLEESVDAVQVAHKLAILVLALGENAQYFGGVQFVVVKGTFYLYSLQEPLKQSQFGGVQAKQRIQLDYILDYGQRIVDCVMFVPILLIESIQSDAQERKNLLLAQKPNKHLDIGQTFLGGFGVVRHLLE
jgi:hypothetical protein